MKRLPRTLLASAALLCVAMLAALAVAAGLALQRTPLVAERPAVSAPDIDRAMQLLHRHDPRRRPLGTMQRVVVSAHDLELLLNHGVRRWSAGTSVRLTLLPGVARLQSSTPAPQLPFDAWVNVELELLEAEGLPIVVGGRIGRLPLPGWLAHALVRQAGLHVGVDIQAPWTHEVVRHVALQRDAVALSYTWQADTHDRLLAGLLPAAEQLRLKAYSDRLVELARVAPATGAIGLLELLQPMFALAGQRSGAGADAAAENRAALVVLGMYLGGPGLSSIVPAAQGWAQPRWLRVTLHGRVDFPQHFVLSALIAAEGSSPLAEAVGVYKELADSRGGSGFSFNDIAAARAGTRFGERAVQQPLALQAALGGPLREFDLVPDTSDLSEFLPEAEFRQRYGGVGSPAFLRALAKIDARLGATPWWQ